MKTNEQLDLLLNGTGFNSKTKAFKSFSNNPKSKFKDFKNVFLKSGYSDIESDIYGIMLLNYHLNGSYPAFQCEGGLPLNCAYIVFNSYNSDRITKSLNNFTSKVRLSTYLKWGNAFNIIKNG